MATPTSLAEKQHGLFRLDQARRAGFTRAAIRHRRRRGTWEPLQRGVYRVPGSVRTWEQRLTAVVFASGPVAAASHRSAAALLGIPGFKRDVLEVTTPRPRRHRGERKAIVHRWRPFPAHHLTVVDGIPTTNVARTLIDLAGLLHPARTERVLDNCLSSGLVTLAAVRTVFDEMRSRGRKGIALMRRLLDARGDGYMATASELEDLFLKLIREAGLPEPDRQVNVGDGERWIGRVDYIWGEARLIVEVDGRKAHTAQLDLEADQARDSRLIAAGWRPMRVRFHRLSREPHLLVADLRGALRTGGPAGRSPPPDG